MSEILLNIKIGYGVNAQESTNWCSADIKEIKLTAYGLTGLACQLHLFSHPCHNMQIGCDEELLCNNANSVNV